MLTFNFKINFKNILFSAFFWGFFPVKIISKTIFCVSIDTPTLVFFLTAVHYSIVWIYSDICNQTLSLGNYQIFAFMNTSVLNFFMYISMHIYESTLDKYCQMALQFTLPVTVYGLPIYQSLQLCQFELRCSTHFCLVCIFHYE